MAAATIPDRPARPMAGSDGMYRGRILTHLDLPDRDETVMENYFENPQTSLLNDVTFPHFVEICGRDNFLLGANSGIYFRVTEPFLRGCLAPDWFMVPNVRPLLPEGFRRSYVLWNEIQRPLLVIEYVSGNGAEERDRTPQEGKFWLYEQAIEASYYVIYDEMRSLLEVWHLEEGVYQPVSANEQGRFPIPPLRIEFGMWQGSYHGCAAQWLRPWDSATGELLPTGQERADEQRQIAEVQRRLTEEQRHLTEEQRRLTEEQRRLTEEQRQIAEEQRYLTEEQRQIAEEQRRIAEVQQSRAEEQRQIAEEQQRIAEVQQSRADKAEKDAAALREKLRAAGIDPDS